ncbi:hypothetical protein BSZ28_11100 [Pseudomonas moraviensis]|nr:hypothetical protein BSZ28_11100 [Pseudomonas moraviensis]
MPMQFGVIKHADKVCGCRDCDTAPIVADHQIYGRIAASSISKSTMSPRHRYPSQDVGTLG